MRRLSVFLVCLAVAALFAAPALAGIGNTSHDGAKGNFSYAQGKCSACHLPHGAVGDRLWPAPVGTTNNVIGDVALLCAYCHYSTGGASHAQAPSDLFVYGNNSHGVFMSLTAGSRTMPLQQLAPTTPALAYVNDNADGNIECTSCHNVHEDGMRPFLRADLNAICAACHGQRMINNSLVWVDANGAMALTSNVWGSYQELLNPGSHPVGRDITVAAAGADNPVLIPAVMSIEFNTSANNWSLGGHLTRGRIGGVTCTTCHAVHGTQEDANAIVSVMGTDVYPYSNFLAVSQGTATLGGRDVASGNGDPRNYLCESCHYGSRLNATVFSGTINTTSWRMTRASNPNPGATSYTHPVDAMNATLGTGWVSAFPNNWPVGLAGAPIDPRPLCESCHVAHPYANRGRVDLTAASIANTGAGVDYMLRGNFVNICGQCHTSTGSPQDHHPVGDTFSGQYSLNGSSFSITYLASVPDVNGSYVTTCGTCHGGGGQGAHNWAQSAAAGYGLDPKWVPYNNARQADSSSYPTFANSLGTTCMDCHYGLAPVTGYLRPTDGKGIQHITEAGYGVLGAASHFMGATSFNSGGTGRTSWLDTNNGFGAWLNPETQDWDTNAMGGANQAYSRFGTNGGAGAIIVCESCHELEPRLNTGDHLLLADFNDGDTAVSQSRLCNGCHLPPGTHPLSNSPVGRREGQALQTDNGVAWLKTPTSGTITDVNLVYAGNRFNCDSCHQVHDAVSNSMTFILDATSTTVPTIPANAATITATRGNYPQKYFPDRALPKRMGGGAIDVERYCAVCHPYN